MDDRAISPRDAAAPWGVLFLLLAGVTLAEALLWLAEAEAGAGHLAEAAAAYERAADVAAAAFGPRHAKLATYLNELGIFRFGRRDYPAAVPVFERAPRIREQAFGVDHGGVAIALKSLAGLYRLKAGSPSARRGVRGH